MRSPSLEALVFALEGDELSDKRKRFSIRTRIPCTSLSGPCKLKHFKQIVSVACNHWLDDSPSIVN